MERKRKALSLFSGAGGMDLGIIQAGFEVLASVEMDPHCCETLRENISRQRWPARVINADAREIDPDALMSDLRLEPGEIDLLFGGPPCQAFSQIGKQEALRDERGLLLFQMTRFAERLQPKAILIEQVKGLLNAKDKAGHRGEVLHMILSDLDRLGYVPKWHVVNAASYGVPQLRERVFIVAVRRPAEFEFPAPTHGPSEMRHSLFPLPSYVTVGEALIGLGLPSPKNGGEPRDDSHVDVTPEGDRFRIHGVPEGRFLAVQYHLPEEQRRNLQRKDTTKFLRASRSRPANTLRCGEIFFHPCEDRYLTPREYMRIHGYPDWYVLRGPIRGRSGTVRNLDQHRQVANSVPPLVSRRIAESVAKVLDGCRASSSSLVSV